MRRRILSLALAAVLLLSLLPGLAAPAAAASSGSCGKNLNWSFDAASGTLRITGSGEMDNYGDLSSTEKRWAPWHDYYEQIKSLSLPSGLTGVGDCAFEDCGELSAVSLPAKVRRIGHAAFSDCLSLRKINFPEGLTEIGADAFSGCEALESVSFPNSLRKIGDYAFYNCSLLTELHFPEGLRSVGAGAFLGCEQMQRVVAEGSQCYVYLFADYYGIPYLPAMQADNLESMDLENGTDDCRRLLGPWDRVEIFGVAPGAEGEYRDEVRKVFDVETGDYRDESVRWAQSLDSYAAGHGYRFYPLNKFADVKAGDACRIPVAWAVGNKVTAGMDATHFAPKQTVTRAQAMTFFWAAQHKPKFQKASTRFVDVKKTDWFYKSVMWAVEQGVTAGTDATHFSPNKTCNRGEILAFLYASLKKPKVSIKNPYSDVGSQWYKKAALWAWANGIEKGENGTFNASTPCTRASTVTYLYRFFTGRDLAE